MKNFLFAFCLLALTVFSTGCWKPYHEKMLVDIETSEIAVLVETVNDNGQAVIVPKDKGENQTVDGEQIDFYKNRVVNARKVEIPYYWKQTHRYFIWEDGSTGEWQPSARLITVDTQPETREWRPAEQKGQNDQGIWAESKDSVGFSTGISITARINSRDDAITFLSNYPPKGERQITTAGGVPFNVEVSALEDIMDQEVRVKVQELFAHEAANYYMDELREKKQEILKAVKFGTTLEKADGTVEEVEGVVDFFKKRGITITAVGQFGGFTYENPEIQLSIDKVFQAQQDEEVAKAETKAAEARKEALKLQGEGQAEQAIEIARGKAEGVKLEAEAEAEAIKAVADAKAYELEKLSENPEAYLALKNLEIEMERLQAWDGKYPQFLMGEKALMGGQTPLLLQMPAANK